MIAAAQYLRMSTEHQKYSLDNQAEVIDSFARANDFSVIATYTDAGKSGVTLRNRTGLQQLLADVVSGDAGYKAVLVYDVSRWGRFQDTDEAAHYEFLCKSAGVPIHYCAEQFGNQIGIAGALMKALKRAMAAEYSRELSVKVRQGHERLARLGYKQGGPPGYGLRRQLVPFDSRPSRILVPGERKGLTDRVILVPGPAEEVTVVREIFEMFTQQQKSLKEIPRILNSRRIPSSNGGKWDDQGVRRVLTGHKYAGHHVYGRRTESIAVGGKTTFVPSGLWVVAKGAFKPIIDQQTFDVAQARIATYTINLSNEQILNSIRGLQKTEGRLSAPILERSRDVPSVAALVHRFGTLSAIYDAIGYKEKTREFNFDLKKQQSIVRDDFLLRLASVFKKQVELLPPSSRNATRRRVRLTTTKQDIAIVVARHTCTPVNRASRWVFCRHRKERDFPTILIRLAEGNVGTKDIHVLPPLLNTSSVLLLAEGDPLLAAGRRLKRIGGLIRMLKQSFSPLNRRFDESKNLVQQIARRPNERSRKSP